MGEFYGSLQDIGLPEILSFLKGLNKTGSLRISQGRLTAEASLDAGRVTAASFGEERGASALEAIMLGLSSGSFTFTDGSLAGGQNVDLEPDELQARLAAFDEERKALALAVPSLAGVPRVAKAPGTTGEVVLDGGAIETLLAVNGERTIAELARTHGLVQTARELAKLLDNGLISVDAQEPEPVAQRTIEEAPAVSATPEPEAASEEPPVAVDDRDVQLAPAVSEVDRAATDAGRESMGDVSKPDSESVGSGGRGDGELAEAVSSRLADEGPPGQAAAPAAPAAPRESAAADGASGAADEQREPETSAPEAAEEPIALAASGPCPKLGYVDDPANRYSRPTQLHRCFATGVAERVSTPEQRDLCLTNRYPSCPRFIAAGGTAVSQAAEVVEREPAETRVGRSNRPNGQPSRDLNNGGSPRSYRGHALGAPLTVQAPDVGDRPSPRSPSPREVARAAVAEERAAEPEAAARAPEPSSVGQIREAMADRALADARAAAAPVSPPSRKLVPAMLLVTAFAIATLAIVLIRASSAIPDVTDEDVARLATSVANNPSSAAPPPSGAQAPSAPSISTGSLRTALDVRFSEPPTGWPNDPSSTAWWSGGEYHVFARQPGQFVAIGAPTRDRFGDVVATATFRKVGGPPGGGYGFIIRDQGPGPRDGLNQSGQYYVLEVGDRGEYGIWRREGDRWLDLIPWTPSELVPRGNVTNEVTVQATGQELTFLVNGQVLANLVGAVLRDGGIGIFVGGDLNEVVVERFVVQTPAG